MRVSFMDIALAEARLAASRDEVPVGAVIVRENEVIAKAGNRTRELLDPSAHAEILAIREACSKLAQERLIDCDLYVTLEPCAMCAGAISFARIRRLYYSAQDAKSGGVAHGGRFFDQATCHHAPEIYSGMAEQDSQKMLQEFFREKRAQINRL